MCLWSWSFPLIPFLFCGINSVEWSEEITTVKCKLFRYSTTPSSLKKYIIHMKTRTTSNKLLQHHAKWFTITK